MSDRRLWFTVLAIAAMAIIAYSVLLLIEPAHHSVKEALGYLLVAIVLVSAVLMQLLARRR